MAACEIRRDGQDEYLPCLGTPNVRAFITPDSSYPDVPLVRVSIPSHWDGPSIEGALTSDQLRVLISQANQALEDVRERHAICEQKAREEWRAYDYSRIISE